MMPTGYTAALDEKDLNTSQWFTEHLARAFGVCIILRDGPYGLSADEIEQHLEKEIERGTQYHEENLKEAKDLIERVNADPKIALNEVYNSMVKQKKEYNTNSIKEARDTKKRHKRTIRELKKIQKKTTDEVTHNIAQFGLKQLELVKSETEPYVSEIPSLEKFIWDKAFSLNRDLKYHEEKIIESTKREQDRFETYRTIRSEVERILGSHSSTGKAN